MVNTLRARRARIPSEVGAYLVLETCEKIQARPSAISAEHVCVGDAGEVALRAGATACDEREAAASLCRLLSFLLVASEDNISPGLLEILEVDPSAWTLTRLRDALEANLVPLNRQASRRVLSRLVRESQRPGPSSDFGAPVVIPTTNLRPVDTSRGEASLDAFLSDEAETLDRSPVELAFDGDPDLDLPDLDPVSLDLPEFEVGDVLEGAQSVTHEQQVTQSETLPEPAAPKASIFSDRESYFESLDDSESNKGLWLWLGVGALVVAGLVAASVLI